MTNIFELGIHDFETHQGQTLSKRELEKEVVLLFFKAKWCRYCQIFLPDYITLAKNLPYIKFGIIDIDNERDLVKKINEAPNSMYKVQGFPTLVVYKNGEFYETVTDRSIPALSKQLNNAYLAKKS